MRRILNGWHDERTEVLLTAGVVPEERCLFFVSLNKGPPDHSNLMDARYTEQEKAEEAFQAVVEHLRGD